MTDAKFVSQRKLRKIIKDIIVNITQIDLDMNLHASKLKSMSSYFILSKTSSPKNDAEWFSCLENFNDLLRKKRCFTNYLHLLKRLLKDEINLRKEIL